MAQEKRRKKASTTRKKTATRTKARSSTRAAAKRDVNQTTGMGGSIPRATLGVTIAKAIRDGKALKEEKELLKTAKKRLASAKKTLKKTAPKKGSKGKAARKKK